MRHGKYLSKPEDPKENLSRLGKEEVQQIAFGLKKIGLCFDVIYSSPKTRAFQTAHIVSEQLDYPDDRIMVIDDLTPDADAEMTLLKVSENTKPNMLLVGHLPNLENIVEIVTGSKINFAPGSICKLVIPNLIEQKGVLKWIKDFDEIQLS